MTSPSYDRGEAEPALLTATIGAQLEMTTDRFGERTALVDVPSGRRWTYDELLAADERRREAIQRRDAAIRAARRDGARQVQDAEIAAAKEWDDEGRRRAGVLVDGFLEQVAAS